MRTADIISCGLVVLCGLVLLFFLIPGWIPVEAGPGFGLAATTMPYVAVTAATAMAALFFTHRLRNRPQETEPDQAADEAPIPRKSWVFLLRGAIFLIVVTSLFEWIGFLVAGPLTVAGFMIMMGERRPIPICVTSVCATAATWLFFWQFLKFPLP